MRYLLAIIMALFLATPALAESYCRMNGPNNCNEQITLQLVNITQNAIDKIHRTQDEHAFKTENDYILAAAAGKQQHAAAGNPPAAMACKID